MSTYLDSLKAIKILSTKVNNVNKTMEHMKSRAYHLLFLTNIRAGLKTASPIRKITDTNNETANTVVSEVLISEL
jgi:hypothetical protein